VSFQYARIRQLIASAAVAATVASGVFSMTNNTREKLQEALSILAETYKAPILSLEKKECFARAGRLAAIMPSLPAECQPPLRYHQARLLTASGDVPEAVQILDSLLEDKSPAMPEAFWLHVQIWDFGDDEVSSRRRWNLEDRLGVMLPISSWGALFDARLAQREADRTGASLFDADWPTIPIIDGKKLISIAEEYAAMGMLREAAVAYREALYGGFAPPGLFEPAPQTWQSEEAAAHWLKAARLDTALARTGRAFQALCIAMTAAPAKLPEAITILSGASRALPGPSIPTPDPNRLQKIANLYRSCNLHPLALGALSLVPKGANQAECEKLRSEISAAWEQLVTSYVKGRRGACFLFGQKVSGTEPKQLSPKRFPY
jgi:tetratricopeptide (TPR) repeat protein